MNDLIDAAPHMPFQRRQRIVIYIDKNTIDPRRWFEEWALRKIAQALYRGLAARARLCVEENHRRIWS
jgi:hypothetical protein